MKVVIREAHPADASRLVEIEQQCFTHPHWRTVDFLRYDCLVAEIDDRIVGFLVSREIFPARNGALAEREILNLAVAPHFQRRGIATILMKKQLTLRAAYFLEVRQSNIAAQTLYRALGFVEVGQRAAYYQEPLETAIVMRLK